MIWLLILLIVLVTVLILCVVALIGIVSTGVSQLRILAGATAMLATTFDERCSDDASERMFFRNMRQSIYHGILDGAFQSRQ